jgi:L-asparaginase II
LAHFWLIFDFIFEPFFKNELENEIKNERENDHFCKIEPFPCFCKNAHFHVHFHLSFSLLFQTPLQHHLLQGTINDVSTMPASQPLTSTTTPSLPTVSVRHHSYTPTLARAASGCGLQTSILDLMSYMSPNDRLPSFGL